MARPNLGKLLAEKLRHSNASLRPEVTGPARTRFAPSPTGSIHLGSLRTALYNYLLARHTKGQFILRIEDTDRTRLKPHAEENIYKSLKWANLHWDIGPIKQSERESIYKQHAETLLEKGHAYRCFCSKERLDALAESARQLKPPSTASYDRKCFHLSKEESDLRAKSGKKYVLRFKSPPKWPKFTDILHGTVEANTQVNPADPRYDDFVVLKSDGMPTYHFANVVDDSLMKITHVIRGEEWIPSTPKHVALYEAFNLKPPQFVHIPLLTEAGGKKLSKRKSAEGVFELAGEPHYIGPEALVNFVALLGWSPLNSHGRVIGEKVNEVRTLNELETEFSLEGLTKGNVQVDFGKLFYLDKRHFENLMVNNFDEAARRCHNAYPSMSLDQTKAALKTLKSHVSCVSEYIGHMNTIDSEPAYSLPPADLAILKLVIESLYDEFKVEQWDPAAIAEHIVEKHSKKANKVLRYILLDGKPGVSIVEALSLLGRDRAVSRTNRCMSTWIVRNKNH